MLGHKECLLGLSIGVHLPGSTIDINEYTKIISMLPDFLN